MHLYWYHKSTKDQLTLTVETIFIVVKFKEIVFRALVIFLEKAK